MSDPATQLHRLREQMADVLLSVVLTALKDAGYTLPEHGREAQAIRDILLLQVLR